MHWNIITALSLILLQGRSVQAQNSTVLSTCEQIAAAISSASAVYYPLALSYTNDINHYATSSQQSANCSVEPGTAEDVGTILRILGQTGTEFAVKGGGHIMNPGYSSTLGVQISMTRFDSVVYDASTETAAIGAGLVWDDVYESLQNYNVTVVGGRVSGIGVAGYTLGGGYSFLTNQHGLTLDTVQVFELALPNGTVTNVSESSNTELFYGLKGGYNNYGIVTTFTLQTFPQGQVWGGQITYPEASVAAVTAATANFSANVTDPKAAIVTTYDYVGGTLIVGVLAFYGAPTPPAGIFDELLSITSSTSDVSTRDYLSLIQVEPTQATAGFRGYYNTVPLQENTLSILEAVVAQIEYWGPQLTEDSATIVSYDVEPFLPNILTHGRPSAYPYTRSQRFLPLNVYFGWSDSLDDATFLSAIEATALNLTTTAEEEGQIAISAAPHYPNYAIYTTPLEDIYGTALPTLMELKLAYDPTNVMGLAGGWKIPV